MKSFMFLPENLEKTAQFKSLEGWMRAGSRLKGICR